MRDWFRNQFRKLGNQALIYNKRQKEMEDGSELAFTWLEVDLQNGTLLVRLHMNDVSGIAETPPTCPPCATPTMRASWATPALSRA